MNMLKQLFYVQKSIYEKDEKSSQMYGIKKQSMLGNFQKV